MCIMLDKIKQATLPHFIGFCLLVTGWWISILNVGLDKFSPNTMFTPWTFFGLALIIIGAYLPEVWTGSRKIAKPNITQEDPKKINPKPPEANKK